MHDLRILREQYVNGGFIVEPRIVDEPHFVRAAVHEELEGFVMTASFGDLMRRDMPAESPLIDRASGFSPYHREVFLTDTDANAIGVRIKVFFSERDVSERRSHQEVSFATALNKITCKIETFAE